MNEGSYNLYNALTDKELYFDVDGETVNSFLTINNPPHPFLPVVEHPKKTEAGGIR